MEINSRPNILIVDDIEQNVEFIKVIIKGLPVNIIEAYSGKEALLKIQNHELALALIDVQMPEMNGIELAIRILKETHREIFPIIFITAYAPEEGNLDIFYKSGITDYIRKPFPKFILLSKVKVFLELYLQKQRLADSEKMSRMLLDASPEGIVIMDISGSIQEVSTIALKVLGTEDKNSLLGKNFSTLLPKTEHTHYKKIIQRTLKQNLEQNIELRMVRADGTQFMSEISTTLIYESHGNKSSVMAIIRDISQRKEAEQQQIQTERMASLGEMATGIAHEINQPLNNISFGLENLFTEIGKHPEFDTSYLEKKSKRIFDNVDRISYIIDHIRTFSQGQSDVMKTSFNINESIRNGVSMISEQFKQRGIDLILTLDDTVPAIHGNTHQFEQVILNLLLNAKDAIVEKIQKLSDTGEKTIRIVSYQNDNTICIEVTDSGIGMTPGTMSQVMFPFYTTKESGKGTGLGLSISLGIIKELNGTIEVESQYSRGTTLRIVVPVKQKYM
ncbi:PAS domain S-box protein [Bacteroidota bacterium]